MNEKITAQDLASALAARHGMTAKDANEFVRGFFALIENALMDDRIVKVKGLGTFKLILVENRESVNINTGERFEIKEHVKVSFIPDASLRDTINKPFACFEAVVMNDGAFADEVPVEEEEETTEETIEEEADDVTTKPAIEEEKAAVAIVPIEKETDEEPKEEEEPEKEAAEEGEEAAEEEGEEEENDIKVGVEDSEDNHAVNEPLKDEGKAKKKSSSPIYLLIAVLLVLLLCGGAIYYMYHPDMFSSGTDNNIAAVPPTEAPAKPSFPDSVAVAPTDTLVKKDTVTTPKRTPVPPQRQAFTADSTSCVIVGTKGEYTIKEGETLTRVALRFYGTKALWPYLVKHNLDVIKNPDNVPVGTVIKIPELVKQ
ncbi:MAG: HU family DNA-binding protein [Mediterranea sp.]|jgi:nucleoid DNA-binding protein/LysM repeat protein|nr:HU family DNA-binding protein [Mediterranea sp.]